MDFSFNEQNCDSGARTIPSSHVYPTKPALKNSSNNHHHKSASTSNSQEILSRAPRLVVLDKGSSTGFGFNILGGNLGEGIYVSFVLTGSCGDINKQIKRGDQILRVNGVSLINSSHEEAVELLKQAGQRIELLVQYRLEEYRNCESRLQEFNELMSGGGRGAAKLALQNGGTLRTSAKKSLHVRALFDYDFEKDSGLPNKGLSFRFGDILHVSNASDEEWWQARRVSMTTGEPLSGLGIIPARNRMERKERARLKRVLFTTAHQRGDCAIPTHNHSHQTHNNNSTQSHTLQNGGIASSSNHQQQQQRAHSVGDLSIGGQLPKSPQPHPPITMNGGSSTNHTASSVTSKRGGSGLGGTLLSRFRGGRTSKESASTSAASSNQNATPAVQSPPSSSASWCSASAAATTSANPTAEGEEGLHTYEAVVEEDCSGLTRPIVVLGPMKEQINERLVLDSPLFRNCVPHTTRPKRAEDVEGVDYHFVGSRAEMEAEIAAHRFIEAGQFGGHLYGTSVAAVRRLARVARLHCVLDVSPAALRRLRLSGLHPIAILIKVCHADQLRRLLATHSHASNAQEGGGGTKRMSEEQVSRVWEKLQRLEHEYLPWFSAIVTVSDDFESIYSQVRDIIAQHSTGRIWLPVGAHPPASTNTPSSSAGGAAGDTS